jgi:ATP-dependent Clp protease adapter protein ClpS
MSKASAKADGVRLIIHDDDDTPRSFVVGLIRTLFDQPQADAIAISRMIERQGKVVFGPYERTIGGAILKKARARIKEAKHSLRIASEAAEAVSKAGPDLCSFCEKSEGETELSIAGKTMFICEDCLENFARSAGFRRGGVDWNYACEVLDEHFERAAPGDLVSTTRHFPAHMRADLQVALEKLFSGERTMFFGIRQRYRYDSLNYAKLCESGDDAYPLAVAQYREIDLGEAAPAKCLENGLWIGDTDKLPYAVVLSPNRDPDEAPSVAVEITALEWQAEFVQRCFAALESAVSAARAYRGKILSFDNGADYRGRSRGLMVHRLPRVEREDVILPEATLKLLDRNVLHFVETREQLRALGQSTRKGILLYGPPGTGKTHTIRYLASNLAGHTTLIITAAQMALLGHYMTLARLLQPALVVIEDVDLIARDREQMSGGCEEPLLNQLLNEMDGLKEDADIIFVLTTNRPEQLENALAGRPGRIDQAIEVPLPDETGRKKLVRLYGRGLVLEPPMLEEAVQRTQGVSAAFIKELMRRTAQSSIARSGGAAVQTADLSEALDDMLFAGGKLNVRLLGGAQDMSRAR